jgi:hypothetical protein
VKVAGQRESPTVKSESHCGNGATRRRQRGVDEETTAHTGGLLVACPEGVLWRCDEGQRRARIRKDGGKTAVGCAKVDRAAPERSGSQRFTSPPQTNGGVGQGAWLPS